MKKKIQNLKKKYWRNSKIKKSKRRFSETFEQKEFNDFIEQIKEEHKNIDINSFKNVFNYDTPHKVLKYLHSLEKTDDYNQATSFIKESFTDFKDEVEIISEGDKKNKGIKILNIVDNILNFTSKERKKNRARFKNTNTKPNA